MSESSKASSGVYLPSGGWWYEEFRGEIGNGSFNDVSIGLGYDPSQVYGIYELGWPYGIFAIGMLPLTKQVLFVRTKGTTTQLRTAQVDKLLSKRDWKAEYDAVSVDDMLDDGIQAGTWSVAFMQRVLPSLPDDLDQVFHSDDLGYYLFIQTGRLVDYESSDGLTKWGKHLNELNPTMVNCWLGEGFILHGNKVRAIDYVNLQADAWASLPGFLLKRGLLSYGRKDGSIDFFLLGVNEGGRSVSLADFTLRIGSKVANTGVKQGDALVFSYEGRVYRFVDEQSTAIDPS